MVELIKINKDNSTIKCDVKIFKITKTKSTLRLLFNNAFVPIDPTEKCWFCRKDINDIEKIIYLYTTSNFEDTDHTHMLLHNNCFENFIEELNKNKQYIRKE